MKKEKVREQKKPSVLWRALKWTFSLPRRMREKSEEREIEKKREKIGARYEIFKVVEEIAGDFVSWENGILKAESKIGIILGARGSGKTAFGVKLMENLYAKQKSRCYAIGFDKNTMPSWIEVVESVGEIKNNSSVLIDEGGILFSSRKSMTKPNQLLSELILISRHKNLNIFFISQNSSNLDVNIIRQADFLVLKPTSLLQKDFERKKIAEVYSDVEGKFKKYKNDRGITYIYANEFRGFVSNSLPSFWSTRISKSFRKN